jgi:prepilin-type N-terminal cleavage/methylation domain-containing protein
MKAQRGFSLLEVLFAIVVMAIALFSMLKVLVWGVKAQNKTEMNVAAYQIANRVLERSVIDLGRQPVDVVFEVEGEEVVGHNHFFYVVTSTDVENQITGKPFGTAAGADDNRLKVLEVTVRWGSDPTRPGVGKQEVTVSRLANRRSSS